jgi:hypothetical protein
MILPGSRTLSDWWRALSGLQPQQLWFGQYFFHRIEALIEVGQPRRLDGLNLAVLRLVAQGPPWQDGTEPHGHPGLTPDGMYLDYQVRGQVLRHLKEFGLICPVERAVWELTHAGRQALAGGEFVLPFRQRRSFIFVDNSSLNRAPHFLPLEPAGAEPFLPGPDWKFGAHFLEECVRRQAEWKRRFRFPTDVVAVHALPASEASAQAPPDWRQVLLDQPGHLFLALVQVAAGPGGRRFLGYAVRTENWALQPDTPTLELTDGWEEAFPELTEEPSLAAWRQSWQKWSQPRSLPPAEVDTCQLQRTDHRLVVKAPKRLIDRLRAVRSDVFKQGTWLLAGTGRSRKAALVETDNLGFLISDLVRRPSSFPSSARGREVCFGFCIWDFGFGGLKSRNTLAWEEEPPGRSSRPGSGPS